MGTNAFLNGDLSSVRTLKDGIDVYVPPKRNALGERSEEAEQIYLFQWSAARETAYPALASIKSNTFDGEELTPLIAACKIDLGLGGVRNISDTDALVTHAVVLYCKAHFGFDDNADKYAQAYENLKNAMAISTEYGTEPETEESGAD